MHTDTQTLKGMHSLHTDIQGKSLAFPSGVIVHCPLRELLLDLPRVLLHHRRHERPLLDGPYGRMPPLAERLPLVVPPRLPTQPPVLPFRQDVSHPTLAEEPDVEHAPGCRGDDVEPEIDLLGERFASPAVGDVADDEGLDDECGQDDETHDDILVHEGEVAQWGEALCDGQLEGDCGEEEGDAELCPVGEVGQVDPNAGKLNAHDQEHDNDDVPEEEVGAPLDVREHPGGGEAAEVAAAESQRLHLIHMPRARLHRHLAQTVNHKRQVGPPSGPSRPRGE
mmetsp:Transcript_45364/g.112680  ORF Transcript_45364/g.112680 Transcript_45364/m.112680 type:complete len:281 (+) Transcript_45364:308-1150(+)